MSKQNKKQYWLGFDLGGTKMMATVFDRRFNVIGNRRKKSKHTGSTAGLTRIIQTIEEALESAKIEPHQLAGMGIGSPGPLDLNRGIVVKAPNLGWQNLPLKSKLERRFHCPVVVVNDVDAGTYGEYRFGAGQGAHCVVGVFPGTGVGGGCVYDGKLIRGRIWSCMEIGHIRFQTNGRPCGCGHNGCLETVTSRLAIASEAAVAAYRGRASHLFDHAGTDITAIRSSMLARAIKDGDRVIEDIVRTAARNLGIGIGSLVNIMAPDVVVLGGGLVEAMPRLYVEEVRQGIREQAMRSFLQSMRVTVAKLGDDAAVMGAAALAAEEVLSRKRSSTS